MPTSPERLPTPSPPDPREVAKPVAPGIFKLKRSGRVAGFRVWVSVSDPDRPKGRLVTKRFKPDTPLSDMKQWREDQRVSARRSSALVRAAQPSRTGFAADARTYLAAVAAMPSYADRERDINRWIALFGERGRSSITSAEIAAALSAWLNAGAAPATVNHRRTALMHMWAVLDGKQAANPVRSVPKFREPDPQPRGISYDIIRRLLDAMPRTKSRARLKVLAWTGIPHAQIARITPTDIDFEARRVIVRARRKGQGAPGRAHPLTADGVLALREFVRLNAFGPFSRSSLRKSFRLAVGKIEQEESKKPKAKRISLAGIRPYDLRHSFGSAFYAASGDIRATQIAMGHSSERMTHRYTLSAVDGRLLDAVALFEAATTAKRSRRAS